MNPGPLFQQIIVALPIAPCEVVAAALQQQSAVLSKGNPTVGAIHFFFHHKIFPPNVGKGDLGQIFISRLKPGPFQVRCPGVCFYSRRFHKPFLLTSRLLKSDDH